MAMIPQYARAWDYVKLFASPDQLTNATWDNTTGVSFTQGADNNTWTATITPTITAGNFYFRILDSSSSQWGPSPSTTDAQLSFNGEYGMAKGSTNALYFPVSATYSSYTINLNYNNSTGSWLWHVTVVPNDAGSSTSVNNEAGYYIFGSQYPTAGGKMTYKLLSRGDNEYYIDLYAASVLFNTQEYSLGSNKSLTIDMNNTTFQLAYVAADNASPNTYYPNTTSNYVLTNSDGTASTEKFFGSANSWQIQNNGGMYRFVIKVDDSGKPIAWWYESAPQKIVAYKIGASSNWTTGGFLYCSSSTSNSYNKNFFGTVSFETNEEFKFMLGNYYWGKRSNSTNDYSQDVAVDGSDNNLMFQYSDGAYLTEFNPERDYILSGGNTNPARIFILGSAVSGETSDTYANWDPSKSIELVYDPSEQCFKATIPFTTGKDMRFLLSRDAEAVAPTSLATNFGEDTNKPGSGGDTDDFNYVAYNSASTSGTNIDFNPASGTYTIRFYIDRKSDVTGFDFASSGIFHYTLELNTIVAITPVNGKLLRTYCNNVDLVPVDPNLHIYAAQKYTKASSGQLAGDETGIVYLYELKYIPANEGVVLYAGETSETVAQNFRFVPATTANVDNTYSASQTDKTLYWKNTHSSESWNNDLVGVLTNTNIGPSVKDDQGLIVARNYILSHLYTTDYYKNLADKTDIQDKFGFYRAKEFILGANKAYLQLDSSDGMTSNGQLIDDLTDNTSAQFAKTNIWIEGIDKVVTGITELHTVEKQENNVYYNIQGVKVSNPSKGLYIHNGKKIVIK